MRELGPAADGAPPPLRVAIVGRANVGKSTLFNRLSARAVTGLGGRGRAAAFARKALVLPTPRTTRDVQRAAGGYGGAAFELVDTAGLELDGDAAERRAAARRLSLIHI